MTGTEPRPSEGACEQPGCIRPYAHRGAHTYREYPGRCLECGDEWTDTEPAEVCPECGSLDVIAAEAGR